MKKYSIKKQNKDFYFIDTFQTAKGTRVKKFVVDKKGERAFFKYEAQKYIVSEACSEKMCYEIAKVLGFRCAKIELAYDIENNLGVLNYWFTDNVDIEHTDAVSYLKTKSNDRKYYYTISNIKDTLDRLNSSLFKEFINLMVFDALVGEQDRHEENWGIIRTNMNYEFSPLYDNGDSLLNFFKDETYAQPYYDNKKDFDAYIMNSKTYIYKEDNVSRYKHFELIKYLNTLYKDIVQESIANLNKLDDKKIKEIVEMIPDELLTKKHKKYIIEYLIKRRDILIGIK